MRSNQECVESRRVGVATVAEVARVVDWVAHRRDSLEAVPKHQDESENIEHAELSEFHGCETCRSEFSTRLKLHQSQLEPVATIISSCI